MSDVYLVTGATGFIGSNIVRKLVGLNKNVHIITRKRNLNWRIADLSSRITIHNVDLLSPNLPKVLDKIKPSYVFHLAAYGSLPEEKDIDTLIDVNLLGAVNLLNCLKKKKFKLFINTGSSSEYGIKNKAMAEDDFLDPVNDYGVVKAVSTLYLRKEAVRENLPIITFRLFSPFGPYEEKSRLIPYAILQSFRGRQINLSSESNVRDFTYIDDIINAYLKACDMKFMPGEIFNIATGKQRSVRQVLDLIIRQTNSSSKVVWGAVSNQKRQIEPRIWRANVKKSKEFLGWEPEHSLKDGIKETIEWFKRNNNLYE